MNLKICDIINKLKSFKVSPNQFGLLYLLQQGEEIKSYLVTNKMSFTVVKELIRREFILRDEESDSLILTALGSKVVEAIKAESEKPTAFILSPEVQVSATLKKFQEADLEWLYYWREDYKKHRNDAGGSLSDCITKMKKFLKTNPDATPELINKATNAYINSLDNLKYMRKADYFINKQYSGSLLEEWIEIVSDETTQSEWGTNSIN
jgi:hypothetical protein